MQIGGGCRTVPTRRNHYPLSSTTYPLSFHILAHSFALFCTQEKLKSFLFMPFRTLCQKHPGVGYPHFLALSYENAGVWRYSSQFGTPSNDRGSSASFLHKVKRSFQLQFELCALRQVQLVAATGFHEVRCERPKGCALGRFFLVFVLYAFHGPNSRARSGCLCGVVLVAGSPFDQSFFGGARFDAV